MEKSRKRRGRCEGSIFQRADGLWVGSVSAGYGRDGKRQRRTAYGATKKEAQDELDRLRREIDQGLIGDVAKLTVPEFLDAWLEAIKPTVQPNTYVGYKRHVDRFLKPRFDRFRLVEIRPRHVAELYGRMLNDGVSAATVRKVGTTLGISLNHAVNMDLVEANVTRGVKKPKGEHFECTPLDPDQVARFLKAATSDRYYAFFVLALDSGMRPGELLALTWSDVDFEGKRLFVTKSLEEISGNLRVKDVKTSKSRRCIPISQHTLTALHQHRKRMLAEGHLDGPVFCNTVGKHLRINDLREQSWVPVLKKAGLTKIRLYDLRHTCATLLLLAGEPAKVVSERLGHSTITLTLDTYSHVLPTMQARAADVMGQILGRKPARKRKA